MLNLEIRDPSVNLSYLQYAEGLSRFFLMTEAILFTVNTLELLVISVV